DLHDHLRNGRYQAAPVVRVWIEKEDGGQRPIGKPAFEDKIVQRAVAMLLEAIYEHSILKFFQVDITGMFRMTSRVRYFREGVGSSRPNWRWIMCFLERPKANTSCKAVVKRLSFS